MRMIFLTLMLWFYLPWNVYWTEISLHQNSRRIYNIKRRLSSGKVFFLKKSAKICFSCVICVQKLFTFCWQHAYNTRCRCLLKKILFFVKKFFLFDKKIYFCLCFDTIETLFLPLNLLTKPKKEIMTNIKEFSPLEGESVLTQIEGNAWNSSPNPLVSLFSSIAKLFGFSSVNGILFLPTQVVYFYLLMMEIKINW